VKIGIIGSGNVGGALGCRWAKVGHEIVFGSRDPQGGDMKELVGRAGGKSRAATPPATAEEADVLLLATPWPATQQIVESLGELNGKIILDATNPMTPDLSGLTHGTTTSGGEQVAQWARGAKVVKAFNSVGSNIMTDPSFGGRRPVMFYCSDDAHAKDIAKKLIDEIGFEAIEAGPLRQARLLEPLAMLWVSLAYAQGLGREIAFELLRR
jgi:NADPH-dependent F420 reductase